LKGEGQARRLELRSRDFSLFATMVKGTRTPHLIHQDGRLERPTTHALALGENLTGIASRLQAVC
jgi:hypothetical protein